MKKLLPGLLLLFLFACQRKTAIQKNATGTTTQQELRVILQYSSCQLLRVRPG